MCIIGKYEHSAHIKGERDATETGLKEAKFYFVKNRLIIYIRQRVAVENENFKRRKTVRK